MLSKLDPYSDSYWDCLLARLAQFPELSAVAMIEKPVSVPYVSQNSVPVRWTAQIGSLDFAFLK